MLKHSLIEATEYFAKEVLGVEITLFESCPIARSYMSTIIINGDCNYYISVHIPEETLTKMAAVFLCEDHPNEETLIDLVNEINNIIVGRSKVSSSEKGLAFNISTPVFIGKDELVEANDFEINFMYEGAIFAVSGRKK